MLRKLVFLMPLVVATGVVAWASDTDCSTPDAATVPDGQVNATAHFTTADDGTITISLSNALSDPRSAGQLLSGLAFTVSEGETTGTLASSSASYVRVRRGGNFSTVGSGPTGWALADNFNGGLFLCVLCTDLGASGPAHLIIGDPSQTTGLYSSANASIAGNKPHNPFDASPALFVVNVPGVTSLSTITGATFFFSTAEGVSVGGTCGGGPVPV